MSAVGPQAQYLGFHSLVQRWTQGIYIVLCYLFPTIRSVLLAIDPFAIARTVHFDCGAESFSQPFINDYESPGVFLDSSCESEAVPQRSNREDCDCQIKMGHGIQRSVLSSRVATAMHFTNNYAYHMAYRTQFQLGDERYHEQLPDMLIT